MIEMVRTIRLKCWEEAIGTFEGVDRDGQELVVLFQGFRIALPADPPYEKLTKKLNDSLIGKKVAILRTDIEAKPIIIRVLNKQPKEEVSNG
jgi:hypothetical protein